MRHYEIVALVHPDQSDQMEETASRYQKMVLDSGGKVHRFEDWGRRKLAYPIQKLYKAGYFLLNVECEPSVKDQIENAFRYTDAILRSLVIRKDEAVTEDSPILKNLIKQRAEEHEADAKAEAELQIRIKQQEERKRKEKDNSQQASDETATEDEVDTDSETQNPDESGSENEKENNQS